MVPWLWICSWIVGSQIETKIIFSLIGIHTSFKRSHLQLENLDKLIFVDKNWPNDLRIGCKSPCSFVDFIETNANLKEELKEFEGVFEKDEAMELWIMNIYILQVSIYFQ